MIKDYAIGIIGGMGSFATVDFFWGGHLAEYKYYDMDDVIEKVMKDAENCL